MTLREVVSRLSEYENPEVVNVIYATPQEKTWEPDGIAYVVETLLYATEDYAEPSAPAGTTYCLEVYLAREAIEVNKGLHGNVQTTQEQDFAAVLYYAEHDSYLPMDKESVYAVRNTPAV